MCGFVRIVPTGLHGPILTRRDQGLMAVLAAINLRADHVFLKVSLRPGFCLSARRVIPLSRSRLTSSWAHFLA